MKRGRVVDLTRRLRPGKERFALDLRTFPVNELLPEFTVPENEWYVLQEWKVSSHIGTHIESPFHHMREGYDVAAIPLERVMGDAVVLDFRGKRAGEVIEISEAPGIDQKIKPGDIVLIHTGFDRLYNDPNYDRPYLSVRSAEWLVQRGIACLGIDASGIELYRAPTQPVHMTLLKAGIPLIEELTNLESLSRERIFFIGLPLPIEGADSSPIRAVAVEEG